MIAEMKTTDVHPPLHHAILWVTVRIFGTSEVAVRLPSLVAGVALVPVLFWVGTTLFDRRTGWIAAILAAIAPFCVWYSQEARMYSQFMLFAALAIGFQVLAVRRGRWYDWALYAVSTALLFWTQYFGIMPILVQQAAFGWAVWHARREPDTWRRLARGWVLSSLLVVVLVLPIISVLQGQLAAYGNRGVGLAPSQAGAGSSAIGGTISVYSVGANLIWAFLGYHADGPMVQIAALWPLLMLLAFVMLGRGRSGPSLLLLGLVVVPMGTLFAIGSLRSDLFELRYFSGAVPAMLLLAARVVTATTARKAAVTRRRVRADRGDGARPRRPAAQRRQPPPVRLQGRLRPHRGRRRARRHRAVRTGLPLGGRRLLRPRPHAPRRRHPRAARRPGVGRRDRTGAQREEHGGAARHRAGPSSRRPARSPSA